MSAAATARQAAYPAGAMSSDELQRPRHGRTIARFQAGTGRKIQIRPGLTTA